MNHDWEETSKKAQGESFAFEIEEACKRHNLTLVSCGCCGGIWIEERKGRPIVHESKKSDSYGTANIKE